MTVSALSPGENANNAQTVDFTNYECSDLRHDMPSPVRQAD